MGPLTLECAYYGWAGNSPGRHPVLSLVGRWVSPRLERMIGGVVAPVVSARSSEMLHELVGLHVPTTQVERVAKAPRSDIAEDERKVGAREAAQAPTACLD